MNQLYQDLLGLTWEWFCVGGLIAIIIIYFQEKQWKVEGEDE